MRKTTTSAPATYTTATPTPPVPIPSALSPAIVIPVSKMTAAKIV